MGAVLLGKHLPSNRLAVLNHQNVHGAVANVAEHIRSFELGQVLCHSRKALRIGYMFLVLFILSIVIFMIYNLTPSNRAMH